MKKTMISASLLALPLAATIQNLSAADLSITITGIETAGGTISVGVMDGAEGFPSKREAITGKRVTAVEGPNTFVIKGLAPGRYAVAGWYDTNANNKFDTNLLGMPAEPYGFSNNARGSFGPPSFEDAAFDLGEENLSITFELLK